MDDAEVYCAWCGDTLTAETVITNEETYCSETCAEAHKRYTIKWIAKKVRREAERDS